MTNQIAYLEVLGGAPKELAEQLIQEEDRYIEENRDSIERFREWEKEHNYEAECLRLERLRSIMKQKDMTDQ